MSSVDTRSDSKTGLAVLWRLADGRLVNANRAFFRNTGLKPAEIPHRKISELPIWSTPDQARDILEQLKNGHSVSCDAAWQHDDQYHSGTLLADSLELDGEIHGLLVLREAEHKYRELFEQAVVGMYQSTPEGRFLDANPALARMLGYRSPEELMRELGDIRRLYHDPGDRDRFLAELNAHRMINGREFQLRRKNGEPLWVTQHARAVQGRDDAPLYYEGVLLDITARKTAELELARSEQRYRALVENSQVGVFVREDSHYIYVNHAFAAMLGYSEDELIGSHYQRIYAPEDLAAADSRYQLHMHGGETPEEYEARLLHRDGQKRVIVSCTTSTFVQDGKTLMTGTVRDITRQKRIERQLRHNATHDPLTGLPNRTLFTERVQRVMQYSRYEQQAGYAVLFLDLDTFKLINDSLGHVTGDQLLVEIAARLKGCIRPWDTLARHGGDAFTLLLEQVRDTHDVLQIARQIHAAMRKPFQLGEHQVFTNVSIGVAPGKPEYQTTEEVLRDADAAMYRAKKMGKSQTAVFDDSMLDMARQRLRLETELRHALENNEFEAWYQPVIDLRRRRLAGFEALLRWRHPERGVLTPSAFLDAAEESGLILPIGWWILHEATRQLAIWQRALPVAEDLSISVNVAHQQFTDHDMPFRVAEALQQSAIRPASLNIEITETVFMENPQRALEALQRLKRLGVRLHMDDFGTGYSSLSYLGRLPLDTIKIDRSFVTNLADGKRHESIVRAIVQLARELRLAVVAEGIETASQAKTLRRLGCSRGQGWHFGHAMSASEIDALLARGADNYRLRNL